MADHPGRVRDGGLHRRATLAPAPAGASPVIISDDLTGMRFFNPCTGQDMTITDGMLQFVINRSGDASGGFHVRVRGAAQGVVAPGT